MTKDGHPYFEHIVREEPCRWAGFTLRSIDPSQHEWLNDVLCRQFDRMYADGCTDTTKQIKASLRPLRELL